MSGQLYLNQWGTLLGVWGILLILVDEVLTAKWVGQLLINRWDTYGQLSY